MTRRRWLIVNFVLLAAVIGAGWFAATSPKLARPAIAPRDAVDLERETPPTPPTPIVRTAGDAGEQLTRRRLFTVVIPLDKTAPTVVAGIGAPQPAAVADAAFAQTETPRRDIREESPIARAVLADLPAAPLGSAATVRENAAAAEETRAALDVLSPEVIQFFTWRSMSYEAREPARDEPNRAPTAAATGPAVVVAELADAAPAPDETDLDAPAPEADTVLADDAETAGAVAQGDPQDVDADVAQEIPERVDESAAEAAVDDATEVAAAGVAAEPEASPTETAAAASTETSADLDDAASADEATALDESADAAARAAAEIVGPGPSATLALGAIGSRTDAAADAETAPVADGTVIGALAPPAADAPSEAPAPSGGETPAAPAVAAAAPLATIGAPEAAVADDVRAPDLALLAPISDADASETATAETTAQTTTATSPPASISAATTAEPVEAGDPTTIAATAPLRVAPPRRPPSRQAATADDATSPDAQPSVAALARAPTPTPRPPIETLATQRVGAAATTVVDRSERGAVEEGMILLGVYTSRGRDRALVRTTAGAVRVELGDEIDGWRVVTITDASVQLRRGAQSRQLSLP